MTHPKPYVCPTGCQFAADVGVPGAATPPCPGGYCAHYAPPDWPRLTSLAVLVRIAAAGEQPETQLATDLIAAEAAIARVRELHVPDAAEVWCDGCGLGWPCPTIRALDGPGS